MAYASHYYPHPRQPDPGYKLSFRDRLSYGYQYGQSWSNDPERRELERAYNEADRYQRHSHGYHPTSYSDASLTRQSGSHYASPHDKHEVVEGTLVRHPTAAAHVDPRSGSNHSVSESVLAGYNDPLETIHRSRHDSRLGAVTPEVIRTRSHDGGHSVESHRSPSAGPVYHSRSHGGYHWNHATGSSINSFKAHSRVPESHSSYASYGRYRDPQDHFAESDEEDDTDTDSQATSYHDPYRHHSHSHHSEYAHHGHTPSAYGVYEEPRYYHSTSRGEVGAYNPHGHTSEPHHPHAYHGYQSSSASTSTSRGPRGYDSDRATSPSVLDEYEHDLVTGVTYSDNGRTPDYELDEMYWDHAYDRDTSDGEYSRGSDDYDDYDEGAYYDSDDH